MFGTRVKTLIISTKFKASMPVKITKATTKRTDNFYKVKKEIKSENKTLVDKIKLRNGKEKRNCKSGNIKKRT